MKAITPLLLNFIVNALWQVSVIALVALLADRVTRSVTRIRHLVWVAALIATLLLPSLSGIAALKPGPNLAVPQTEQRAQTAATVPVTLADVAPAPGNAPRRFEIGRTTAIVLLGIAGLLVLYRLSRLLTGLLRTRQLRATTLEFVPEAGMRHVIERCRRVFGVTRVRLVRSDSLKSPATIGVLDPLVILPGELIGDADENALRAAIGHEFVHIMRRDYLLNLIYELFFLPVSFHPAAALIKRRITQTRELRCDELVAERLLHPEVYARSLVRLAGAALPLNRRAQTIIVGIADSDILEVRIMSLLKRTEKNARRKVLLACAAAVIFAIPCVAAASLAINFEVNPGGIDPQEPSSQSDKFKVSTRIDREQFDKEAQERATAEDRELMEKIANETNPTVKAELQETLRRRQEERTRTAQGFIMNGQEYKVTPNEGGQRRALEEKQVSELAKAAKITMDQAIQIATSSSPGKVLNCSLVGERWNESSELAKPGRVLYHVMILSGDDAEPVINHVLVNAVDGTIVKTEREFRRKQNPEMSTGYAIERKSVSGGTLNGKAVNLPRPEYPLLAMKAGASGAVDVEITVDETGNVIAAHAVSGHPLLQAAAVTAARQATFRPTSLNGEPIKVHGVLRYEFIEQ